jgi:hypothetical protein
MEETTWKERIEIALGHLSNEDFLLVMNLMDTELSLQKERLMACVGEEIITDWMTPELSHYFSSLGKKGGKARMEKLTPERRREIAMLGVEARKKKREEKTI